MNEGTIQNVGISGGAPAFETYGIGLDVPADLRVIVARHVVM
jgi:hypothetical protein